MKRLRIVVICIFVAIGIFLFGATVSAQRTGLSVDERITFLEKKVSALETENQQLKKELSSLKGDYAKHYHQLKVSIGTISQITATTKEGGLPLVLHTSLGEIKGGKGVLTGEPLSK
jgi:peptidoglycan hydrolase CwlO-like protein